MGHFLFLRLVLRRSSSVLVSSTVASAVEHTVNLPGLFNGGFVGAYGGVSM